ncbi:hypothetical protein L1D19_24955 [Vibrio natriegens]|uniref:hypothetical protein n=1 Tax=Vibrio natriegens TaxID=691 RepID=UPI001EFC3AC6|nr:hypothetical protein [Vibrio natriegens]MCG9703306.1 hypothetical protein [Vibrio natriegens]
MIKHLILILCFLFPLADAFADVSGTDASSTQVENKVSSSAKTLPTKIESQVTSDSKLIRALKDQLAQMKTQNDLLKEYQSSLLSTVYWSLSFLGGITVLLIGYGWWSNAKIHEKDKEEIRQEVSNLVEKWEVDIKLTNTELNKEQLKTVDTKIGRVFEELKEIEKSTKDQLDKNSEDFKTLNKLIMDKVDALEISSETLKAHHARLRSDVSVIEERVWDTRGVTSNVLLTQAEGIVHALELGSDGRVSLILKRLKETLEKLLDSPNPELRPYFINTIRNALTKLEGNYAVEVSEVLELLDKIKVSED